MTVDGALLYPQVTARRRMQSLNGMWGFQFDPKFVGSGIRGPQMVCLHRFTRDRQPKAAAYVLKERWETK